MADAVGIGEKTEKSDSPKIPARATHIYGDLMLFHLVIGAMYLAKGRDDI
mgnify:CR=1 FL=1